MSPENVPHFQDQQQAFTAHIRDPEANAIPNGIPRQRMGVYAELFFNGFNDQLSSNFPVLREITPDERWHAMIRDFMRHHRAETPLFTEIGLEFIEYLQEVREPRADDWPFMVELAHYEYAELAVAISDADEQPGALEGIDTNGDLLVNHPVVAPTAWNLSYQYPVHEISSDFLPEEPPEQPTHLVVYRDRLDDVHFLEINAVTQRMLNLLKENPKATGLELLKQIAEELQHPEPDSVIQFGQGLLEDLRERNVILGTRPV